MTLPPNQCKHTIPTIRSGDTVPRYLIHIGPHKTGTTYLQHAFTRLRPALAARGILYPAIWGNGEHGHHDLPPALARGDDPLAAFEEFNRSDAHTVLLSSETFAFSTDADVRRLRSLLAGQPATIVFYCRRWSEVIPSCWQEVVKQGSNITMPEYVLSCLGDPTASPMVDFSHILDRYAAIFGSGSLRLVSYNSALEAGDDLLVHFCRTFLSWPGPPPTGLGRVNESLDMVDTEILRVFNILEQQRAPDARQNLFKSYMAEKAGLPVRWLVERAMQYAVRRVRIDDAAPALARLNAGIAERYRSALVPPFPAGGLFEPRISEREYFQSDYLLVEGVVQTLRAMQETLLQTAKQTMASPT
jgi:hypothetical protein